MVIAFASGIGLVFGSFIGVLVGRLQDGRGFITGRSACDHCRHVLGPADLVPVLSWVALGGRCRYCRARLSALYPALELATAALFGLSAAFWPYGFGGPESVVYFAAWLLALVLLISLALYDIQTMLLPDALTWPLLLVSLSALAVRANGRVDVIIDGLLGAAVTWGFFAALYYVSRGRWIGGGDVKLAISLGLWTGLSTAYIGLMSGFYLATAFVLPALAVGKLQRKSKVPFGPFLIAGFIIAVIWGGSIHEWAGRFIGL